VRSKRSKRLVKAVSFLVRARAGSFVLLCSCAASRPVVQPVRQAILQLGKRQRCNGLARHGRADCCNQMQTSCQNACSKHVRPRRSNRTFDRSTFSGSRDYLFLSAPARLGELSIFCRCHFEYAVMLTPEPRRQRWISRLDCLQIFEFRIKTR